MEPETVVRPMGDGALLIEIGPLTPTAAGRARALARRIREERWPGVYDVVPAYRTVLLRFDPCAAEVDSFEQRIATLPPIGVQAEESGALVEIPVCYGGVDGPDLDDVAAHTGLPADEVIRLHAAAEYRVEFLGFSPGFPYLSGLHAQLATPRLTVPRVRVPAGSVGIAGGQTGFYPLESPGGWRLIGRVAGLRFDPARPDTLPYAPGDRIRFVPAEHRRDAEGGAGQSTGTGRDDRQGAGPALRVVRAGALATVQDRGRFGLAALGYGTAGALDLEALAIANLLAGNDPDAAAIELTADGGEYAAIGDLVVAITGADLAPEVDGEPMPGYRARAMRDGARLRFGARRRGVRAYLAVAGGITTPIVLGSRATDLVARVGGPRGEALRAGDVVPVGPAHQRQVGWAIEPAAMPRRDVDIVVRVVWGPQDDWFDETARMRFAGEPFAVSPRSDRTGLRLEGASIAPRRAEELASEGVVPGAVQVPAGGNPIILLADGRSVGGYAKIATVISADLHLLGQAMPGTRIRFRPIGLDEARQAARAQRARIAALPLRPVPELGVRCLLDTGADGWRCPRVAACLISRRCVRPDEGIADRT